MYRSALPWLGWRCCLGALLGSLGYRATLGVGDAFGMGEEPKALVGSPQTLRCHSHAQDICPAPNERAQSHFDRQAKRILPPSPVMKRILFSAPQWIIAAALLIAMGASPAHGMFRSPMPVPVERLIKKAEDYLETHGKDAEAHYTLGRIHYLAFHLKSGQIPSFERGTEDAGLPHLAPNWMLSWNRTGRSETTEPMDESTLVAHASKAMESLRRAVGLAPKNALYQLGIASLMDEFLAWKAPEKALLPSNLREVNLPRCRRTYATAFELAMEADAKLESMPIAGLESIASYEAAQALIRLAKDYPESLSEDDKKLLKQAEQAEETFKKLNYRAITPIVFSLDPQRHLAALLDTSITVDFDLRGYGPQERWPWVKPSLGFLVWDPERTGQITSARQLFGGYTFEIFRRNGDDALAALDDNGDGHLTGAELEGIRVWFDRNGDGRSQPSEVVSLSDLGIVSIATEMHERDGIHPTATQGITFRDGHSVRTWDWITEPARPPDRQTASGRSYGLMTSSANGSGQAARRSVNHGISFRVPILKQGVDKRSRVLQPDNGH